MCILLLQMSRCKFYESQTVDNVFKCLFPDLASYVVTLTKDVLISPTALLVLLISCEVVLFVLMCSRSYTLSSPSGIFSLLGSSLLGSRLYSEVHCLLEAACSLSLLGFLVTALFLFVFHILSVL